MHGQLELPKARTFTKDVIAWIVLFLLCGLIYLGYWHWERSRVVNTTQSVSKSSNPLILVLAYGRITKTGDDKFISQTQLREHLHTIRDQGFVPVSIEEVKKFYQNGTDLPAKSVLLLFEHGFLSTYENVDPVLRNMRWHATMAVSTQRVEARNTSFLYWNRLQRMLNSKIWDLASAGHAGYDAVSIDNEGEEGRGLFHRRWIAEQGKLENDEQFRRRILWDYAYSKKLMEDRLVGFSALAYVFPFSDLTRLTSDPLILHTNQEALANNYHLGFVDDEFGINDRRSNPLRLNRRRMTSDWSSLRLKNHILAILQHPITTGQIEVAGTDWLVGVGKTERDEDSILLSGDHRADMWVPGGQWSEHWKIEAEVRIDPQQQFWVVQYDTQRPGAFWRWGGDTQAFSLQYSPNGEKVETLQSFIRTTTAGEYHRLALSKRGQGIWVEWDNKPLTDHPLYLPGEWHGKVGWMAWNESGQSLVELRQPKITLLPLKIQEVNSYPSHGEVQRLSKQASQLGALAVPRWKFNKGQFNPLDVDDDLLSLLTHRYGWKLIPTICVSSNDTLSPTWDITLNQFVAALPYKQVHLDLTQIFKKLRPEEASQIRNKFTSLGEKLLLNKPSLSSVQIHGNGCDSISEGHILSLSDDSSSST